ncbi:hypothetical protein EV174_004922, partial [Coemansia sp. RSA 2320]
RDDANATPVPNASEQAAIDSFGTTPVGSMPTNLAAHLSGMDAADASLVGAGGGPLEAEQPE